MRARTPVLKAMTAVEKGELLDALLTDQPALRDRVEALAAARMLAGDRGAIAEEVESALRSLDIDQLNGRAGYRRGVGYVEPGEAADELLDEALLPFLDDMNRRGTLGMTTAAAECAVGILDGLYRCRDGGSESLLEYTPDYGSSAHRTSLPGVARSGSTCPSTTLSNSCRSGMRWCARGATCGTGDQRDERACERISVTAPAR